MNLKCDPDEAERLRDTLMQLCRATMNEQTPLEHPHAQRFHSPKPI